MYLVTNRRLDENAKGVDRLGAKPSGKGPNELRLVEATRRGRGWGITILPDELTPEMKTEVGLPVEGTVYTSRYIAAKLLESIRQDKKHLLVFVHGTTTTSRPCWTGPSGCSSATTLNCCMVKGLRI